MTKKTLDLTSYLMGRKELYPTEWDLEKEMAALDLIKRVNNLFDSLPWLIPEVTSGWRPLAINMKAGGAKRSLHLLGKAVDLSDPDGEIKRKILEKTELLLDFGLWMEHPISTPTWVHLDTGLRDNRIRRIFMP